MAVVALEGNVTVTCVAAVSCVNWASSAATGFQPRVPDELIVNRTGAAPSVARAIAAVVSSSSVRANAVNVARAAEPGPLKYGSRSAAEVRPAMAPSSGSPVVRMDTGHASLGSKIGKRYAPKEVAVGG